MRFNKSFNSKKNKSRGEGVSSYRMTSYLALSKPQTEEKQIKKILPSPHTSLTDMLQESYTVATDNKPSTSSNKVKTYNKRQYISRLELLKENIEIKINEIKAKIKEKLKIIDTFMSYVDMAIEGLLVSWDALKQNLPSIIKNYIDKFDKIPVDNVEQQQEEVEPIANRNYISFVDLQKLNVEFTDNNNYPLFDFSKYKNQKYSLSPAVVDPIATEIALQAIRECAARAASIPPAMEGRYANIPLTYVLENVTVDDLQAFLSYVKAYPGNYVGRNLKISETFATWVVYGAPTP